MTPDFTKRAADMWDYTCPACKALVQAERFSDAHVFCPACGAGPFVTEHECFYNPDEGDEFCTDTLEPAP